MNTRVVKFNTDKQKEFIRDLRKNVHRYFKENNITRYANFNMVIKTVFMISLYFVPFILMLTGTVTGFWPVILMWVLMGFGMSGIGLSIMHDANHGSYSRNKKVNDALGYLINFIGGYRENWKIQHNILHHSYTNIEGFDEDIKTSALRMSPYQKRKKYHRFQAFYAPFLYGLMTIYWLLGKDFIGLIKYKKKNLLSGHRVSFKKAMTELTLNKIGYVFLMVILPIILIDLPWWQVLLGFLLMHFICGMVLALIFQPAHVISETDFYIADENGSVDNNWAIHQLKTTSNFANDNRILSWFIGGLNYQIEHHLFPNICHVHYRKISKIVRETAEKYQLPYYQHKTFIAALRSHFKVLHQLGTGSYEKQHVRA